MAKGFRALCAWVHRMNDIERLDQRLLLTESAKGQREAILNLESPIKIIRIVLAFGDWAGTAGSCLEAEEAAADNRRQIGVYSFSIK